METTYFILGILSIVSLISVGGVVRMFSLVSQLRGRVEKLQYSLNDEIRGVYLELRDSKKDIDISLTALSQSMNDNDREVHRYVDSRYDKLVNEVKKSGKKEV